MAWILEQSGRRGIRDAAQMDSARWLDSGGAGISRTAATGYRRADEPCVRRALCGPRRSDPPSRRASGGCPGEAGGAMARLYRHDLCAGAAVFRAHSAGAERGIARLCEVAGGYSRSARPGRYVCRCGQDTACGAAIACGARSARSACVHRSTRSGCLCRPSGISPTGRYVGGRNPAGGHGGRARCGQRHPVAGRWQRCAFHCGQRRGAHGWRADGQVGRRFRHRPAVAAAAGGTGGRTDPQCHAVRVSDP